LINVQRLDPLLGNTNESPVNIEFTVPEYPPSRFTDGPKSAEEFSSKRLPRWLQNRRGLSVDLWLTHEGLQSGNGD
jgi:hypothetical protein